MTQTPEGELGYDIIDRKKLSWGRETVKSILKDVQAIIDKNTLLLEYLAEKLPIM